MYSLPGIVREYKTRRMCWAGHVACMGEKKNAYVLLFIDLSVQERVCISRQQDEDAKGKMAARTRMPELVTEHSGNNMRTIAGANRQLDCWARPRSANPTCLPPVQREEILRILLWKMRADSVTP
jgi:hypothetical protein